MHHWNRASRSALGLVGSLPLSLVLAACGPSGSGESDGTAKSEASDSDPTDSATSEGSATTAEDTEAAVGWFEVGWGDGQYVPIADGDEFPIVRGGQGAQMFPMPLRGAEFYLPADPTSWMDETGPLVDLEIDIEGFNDGPGGHFKRIANYTLDWNVQADGTYQSSYLPIIVPDGIDAEDLEGEVAHLWVRLRPHEQPALELELDVVVTVISEGLPPG